MVEFMQENPDLISPGNGMDFLSDDGGSTYNRCHCKSICSQLIRCFVLTMNLSNHTVWSNFEIGDLDLWRGEAYGKFFDFLDKKGGFYYEVRTIHRSPFDSYY